MIQTKSFETVSCAVAYLKSEKGMSETTATQWVINNSFKIGTNPRVQLNLPN